MDAPIKIAQNLCGRHGATLLYLTLFGSTLYGTGTPESDVDARGIFIQSEAALRTGRQRHSLKYSSGQSQMRNSSDDMDIDLWSLEYWVLDLLKKGDTGALDLLFSPSNPACCLFRNPVMDIFFHNASRLINPAIFPGTIAYAMHQAKKYGIKGSRLGLFREIGQFLESVDTGGRLAAIMPEMAFRFGGNAFYEQEEDKIVIGGKMHPASTPISEFKRRIAAELIKYGSRAQDALQNRGVDFKALSHALRAVFQIEELCETGKIVYPLKNAAFLRSVKAGEYSWPQVEGMILEGIKKIEALQPVTPMRWDQIFAEEAILAAASGQSGIEADIQALLAEVEAVFDVKILFAAETGSRLWGMASPDSDYDIRFIYIHNPEWYLKSLIHNKKDSIEIASRHTANGLLDASGWDLAKALKLLLKSNASLFEWLNSPIVYRENKAFRDLIMPVLPDAMQPPALHHHYWNMGKNSWLAHKKSASLKSLLYALRGMLAVANLPASYAAGHCLPVDFRQALAQALELEFLVPDAELGHAILELLALKEEGREKMSIETPAAVLRFIEKMLVQNSCEIESKKNRPHIDADEIFVKMLQLTQKS